MGTEKTEKKDVAGCVLCPRKCGVNREAGELGFCGCGSNMQVAKVMMHKFEEPCISGTLGSGAIFFCGCNLRCGYCQNSVISQFKNNKALKEYKEYSEEELAQITLDLQKAGAHNINLITAAHFITKVVVALKLAKAKGLTIPVVYNTSGYEQESSIKMLEGLVDVYLPDYKYYSSILAQKYSCAPDYPIVAQTAIAQMLRQKPKCKFDNNGIITSGVIIRHLVLPGQRQDSVNVIADIAKNFKGAYVSIMNQYTPDFNNTGDITLNRRVTTFEYNSVLNRAIELKLDGYMQERSSAKKTFTPDF